MTIACASDVTKANAFKESMGQAVEKLATKNATKVTHNFKEIWHSVGALNVTAKNDDTAKCLMELVATLKTWDAANIKV